jgi:hypothetical protein
MISYVVPLRRWWRVAEDPLTGYLRWLSERVEVIVVDGSVPELFADHQAKWGRAVRHAPVDPDLVTPNGKVGGVLTGIRLAGGDRVIVADDDVRYDDRALDEMAERLESYDLVWPQNIYDPMTVAGRWDTARILLNRGLGWDFPGTVGLRSQVVELVGGYDGNVIFENLELLRTFEVAGARIARCSGMYVARLPPEPRHLASQQVRYAYESFAQPWRMLAELSVIPTVLLLGRRRRGLAALTAATLACATRGWHRDDGDKIFPRSSILLTPPWLMVRGMCSWIALLLGATGYGLPYANTRIWRAAHSTRALRQSRQAAERPFASDDDESQGWGVKISGV